MLRGRVEVAIFNCPYCNTLLKFRATTAYKKRCPSCQTTLYVFLRVCVGRGSRYRPKSQAESRPVDTILPVVLTPAPANETPLALHVRTRRELLAQQHQLEGEPVSQLRKGALNRLKWQPAGTEVDEFVAELGELGIEGTIESMPNVGVGKWSPGELGHRLVDLDELSERGEVLRVERFEDEESSE